MYGRKHGLNSTGSMTTMTSRALAHHRLAMDSMHGSFVVLHAIREDGAIVDFEIIEANAIVRDAYEPACGQIVGMRLSKLNSVADNTACIPLYERALSTGERVNAELSLALPNGRTAWRNLNVVTVDRDLVAVIANDISAEVAAHANCWSKSAFREPDRTIQRPRMCRRRERQHRVRALVGNGVPRLHER